MDSERDQNLRIACDDGRVFVLKISNAADGLATVDMQTRAMLHIARQDPGLSAHETSCRGFEETVDLVVRTA